MAPSPGSATGVGSDLSSAQPTPRRRHKRHRSQSHIAPTDPLPPLPPLPPGDAIYQTIQPQGSITGSQRGEASRTLPLSTTTAGHLQQQVRTRSKETLIDGAGDYATTTRQIATMSQRAQNILAQHSGQFLQAPPRNRHTRSQSPRDHRGHLRQASHPSYSALSTAQQGYCSSHSTYQPGVAAHKSLERVGAVSTHDHRTSGSAHHHAGRPGRTQGLSTYATHSGDGHASGHGHYDTSRYPGQLQGITEGHQSHGGYPNTIITYDELCESVENERQRRRQREKSRTRCCWCSCGECCRQIVKLAFVLTVLLAILVVACKFWCPDSCKNYLFFGNSSSIKVETSSR